MRVVKRRKKMNKFEVGQKVYTNPPTIGSPITSLAMEEWNVEATYKNMAIISCGDKIDTIEIDSLWGFSLSKEDLVKDEIDTTISRIISSESFLKRLPLDIEKYKQKLDFLEKLLKDGDI